MMTEEKTRSEEVQTISSRQAWEVMQNDPSALLIDVRATLEFLMIGHPVGAIHLAWMDEPDWEEKPAEFVAGVREIMLGQVACAEGGCPPLLLICRSGNRSLAAGKVLIEAGIHNVYNISDGFEGPRDDQHHRSTIAGWRYEGLPWEQC